MQQYIVIFSLLVRKTGYRFNSFEILMLNVTLSDKQNKCLLSLALATVYRPPGPYTDFLKLFSDTHLFSKYSYNASHKLVLQVYLIKRTLLCFSILR